MFSDLHIYTGPTAGPPWGYFVDPKNWAMLAALPRNGSKVFVSEYAAGVSQGDGDDPTFNCYAKFPGGPHLSQGGLGNVQAAVHEAAWMAAMERNGDVVKMAACEPCNSFLYPWPYEYESVIDASGLRTGPRLQHTCGRAAGAAATVCDGHEGERLSLIHI